MLRLVSGGCTFVFAFSSIVYSFLLSSPQLALCRATEDFSGMGNSWKSKFVSIVA